MKKSLYAYESSINKGNFNFEDVQKYLEKFINDLFLKNKMPVIENLKPDISLLDEVNIVDYHFLPSPLKQGIVFLYKVPNNSFAHK
ncbi:hypothetical protein CHH49_09850 [Terribacillus saccharophilus]|nr:hypothetical protein CHH49_09850 [Terribacillus saccharophilus]